MRPLSSPGQGKASLQPESLGPGTINSRNIIVSTSSQALCTCYLLKCAGAP